MKFIYVIKEYIQTSFRCLKLIYNLDKRGTIIRLGILIIFPILTNVINIINARLADNMQKSFGTGVMKYVLPVFGFLVVFTLLDSLFDFLSGKLSYVWRSKMNREVYVGQLKKKKDFTLPFTDSSDFEELKQRIDAGNQGWNSQVSVATNIPTFITIIINLVFTTYIAFSYNPLFAFLIILSSLPGFYFSFTTTFAMRKNWESQLQTIKHYNVYSSIFLNYQSLKDAKASNNSDKFIDIYKEGNTKFTDSQIVIQNHYANIAFVTTLLTTFIIFVVQFFVIKDVVAGVILIGQATLVIVQISRLNTSITSLSSFLPGQYETVVASKYLFLQEETQENIDKTEGIPFINKNDEIEFKNVDFAYTDMEFKGLHALNKEIDDVATKYFGLKKPEVQKREKLGSNFTFHIDNLTIKKGEKIAVVGKNGNGKTTFIQLLLNLYEPQSGDITLFGNNLKELSQTDINEHFSTLFQDYAQTSVKVNEYIGFSERNEIDLEKVKYAAQIATADDFIEKWDHKYEQQLGVYMKGVKPSKGQWQKLALARAFYKDASIVILDEPTAAIDALSSKKIFNNLKDLKSDQTIILISHNMIDIVDFADRILVFDGGRIVGDGNHADLLKNCTTYRSLYESEVK